MLGIIITMIFFTRSPIDKELALVDIVADPKKLISILRDSFFSDFVIYNIIDSRIFSSDWGRRLGMTKFNESSSN